MSLRRACLVLLLVGCGGGAEHAAAEGDGDGATDGSGSEPGTLSGERPGALFLPVAMPTEASLTVVESAVLGECADEHPPAEPFDVGDPDGWGGGVGSVADLVRICRDYGGSNCEEAQLISKDAAICIGRASRLRDGIVPWDVGLNYYENHRRVVWVIMTVEWRSDSSAYPGYDGEFLLLDATTGTRLDYSLYGAIP